MSSRSRKSSRSSRTNERDSICKSLGERRAHRRSPRALYGLPHPLAGPAAHRGRGRHARRRRGEEEPQVRRGRNLPRRACPSPAEIPLTAQDIPLDVVYEDADVVVVNKPRGMVVHPAPGHPDGTLVNALMFHCGESLSGIGGERRPGIVHRIDKDTSGLIIAAKNDFAHLALSEQLADHSLARVYECVVRGRMREDSGTVDAPIARHPSDRKRMAVVPRRPPRRDALGGHRGAITAGRTCAVSSRRAARIR